MQYKVYYNFLREQDFGKAKLQIISEHIGYPIKETWEGPGFSKIDPGNFIEGSDEHLQFIRALEIADIDFQPYRRVKIFPTMDLGKAKLLKMDIAKIILGYQPEEDTLYQTRYDYSQVCPECRGGARLVGINYINNWAFAETPYLLARGKDNETCVKAPFKAMIEKAGLTGFKFIPCLDAYGREDKIEAYRLESDSIMPPALINEDTQICPACGRHSTSHEPIRYSGEILDWDKLQDYNLGYELGLKAGDPELVLGCDIVKPSVYQLCRENGIGEDVVKFEYVYVE